MAFELALTSASTQAATPLPVPASTCHLPAFSHIKAQKCSVSRQLALCMCRRKRDCQAHVKQMPLCLGCPFALQYQLMLLFVLAEKCMPVLPLPAGWRQICHEHCKDHFCWQQLCEVYIVLQCVMHLLAVTGSMVHTARILPKLGLWRLVQLRQRYPASTRVSFVEGDAACAKLHKAKQSASSFGMLYSGVLALFLLCFVHRMVSVVTWAYVLKGCVDAGSVDDGALLNSVRADSEKFGGFDVVIVARGHSAEQMLASIKVSHAALG